VIHSSIAPRSNPACHRAVGAVAAVAALGSLLLGACSHGDPKALPSTTAAAGSTTAITAAPTTTQPPATDDRAVRPVISGLLRQWDVAMAAILATPKSVLDNPKHPLRAPLRATFTPDSPYLRDFDKLLGGYVSHHLANKPDAALHGQRTVYLRTTEAPSADSITFVWCSFDDSTTVSTSTGAVVSRDVAVTQGSGQATRTAGRWALYNLFQLGSKSEPAGSRNPCPGFVSPPRTSR
jgi:hypothetical protein